MKRQSILGNTYDISILEGPWYQCRHKMMQLCVVMALWVIEYLMWCIGELGQLQLLWDVLIPSHISILLKVRADIKQHVLVDHMQIHNT